MTLLPRNWAWRRRGATVARMARVQRKGSLLPGLDRQWKASQLVGKVSQEENGEDWP